MNVWLFDIDGTLILSGGAGQKAVFAAIGHEFGVVAQSKSVTFAGRTDRAIVQELFRLHGIPQTEGHWDRFQQTYLAHLPRYLRSSSGRILDGVHELLVQLGDRPDTHLGLLTGNVRAGAEAKLRHFELWDYFTFGGFGDEHVSRDHVAGQAFQHARTIVSDGLRPDDVRVVGDTVNDIRCARAIGARAIAVATGGVAREELARAEPDELLDDLSPSSVLSRLIGS